MFDKSKSEAERQRLFDDYSLNILKEKEVIFFLKIIKKRNRLTKSSGTRGSITRKHTSRRLLTFNSPCKRVVLYKDN
jgi:hypothetical protein